MESRKCGMSVEEKGKVVECGSDLEGLYCPTHKLIQEDEVAVTAKKK